MSTEPEALPGGRTPPVVDEDRLLRSMVRLAWPVVVQQASFAMVQLVDTALVGNLGEDALAGTRLAGLLLWLSMSGMMAVGVGATAIISRTVGAGQQSEASKVMQTVLVLAVIWGLILMVAMLLLGNWWLGIMGAQPAAQGEGTEYLEMLALGMPFMAFMFAGQSAQQGAGDTWSPMAVGVTVNIINVFASLALVNGYEPFPRMESAGAGLGTAISAAFGALLVFGVLISGRRALTWKPFKGGAFNPHDARRILVIGVPAGLEQAQFNLAFMIYTAIIASLGTAALAAHGVVLGIQALTFNIGFALSIAVSAVVGQSLGARRPDLAEHASYVGMRASLVFMIFVGIVLMTMGGPITDIFVGGEDANEVIDIGRDLLLIFAFAMPGLAVSLSLSGALRGAGDTRSVLYIMAGCTWIVRLVPAYLLAITLGIGVPGAWLAAIMDINVRAVLMYFRFRQGKWKEVEV